MLKPRLKIPSCNEGGNLLHISSRMNERPVVLIALSHGMKYSFHPCEKGCQKKVAKSFEQRPRHLSRHQSVVAIFTRSKLVCTAHPLAQSAAFKRATSYAAIKQLQSKRHFGVQTAVVTHYPTNFLLPSTFMGQGSAKTEEL